MVAFAAEWFYFQTDKNIFMTWYYNGFQIRQDGCKYVIKGLFMRFDTMEQIKKHIDWIKNKDSKIPPFTTTK